MHFYALHYFFIAAKFTQSLYTHTIAIFCDTDIPVIFPLDVYMIEVQKFRYENVGKNIGAVFYFRLPYFYMKLFNLSLAHSCDKVIYDQ